MTTMIGRVVKFEDDVTGKEILGAVVNNYGSRHGYLVEYKNDDLEAVSSGKELEICQRVIDWNDVVVSWDHTYNPFTKEIKITQFR